MGVFRTCFAFGAGIDRADEATEASHDDDVVTDDMGEEDVIDTLEGVVEASASVMDWTSRRTRIWATRSNAKSAGKRTPSIAAGTFNFGHSTRVLAALM